VLFPTRPRTFTPDAERVTSNVCVAPVEQLTACLPWSVCGSAICPAATDGAATQYVWTTLLRPRASAYSSRLPPAKFGS